MPQVLVRVPATTANLGPGFDCLGLALDIWNTFEFDLSGDNLRITCEGEGSGNLPRDHTNLVYRAFMHGLHGDPASPQNKGLHIRSMGAIPVSSGLGSSATAIVAGLLAANALRVTRYSRPQLVNIATQIEGHPDNVSPAILGGLVVSVVTERAQVVSLEVDTPKNLHIVVALPNLALETGMARSLLPENVSLKDAVYSLSRAALLVAAIARGDLAALRTATTDVLHQPYRANMVPGFSRVVENALDAGSLGATLSGSGPSVVAFCYEESAFKVAEAMVSGFVESGVGARAFVTRPSPTGAEVVSNYQDGPLAPGVEVRRSVG